MCLRKPQHRILLAPYPTGEPPRLRKIDVFGLDFEFWILFVIWILKFGFIRYPDSLASHV